MVRHLGIFTLGVALLLALVFRSPGSPSEAALLTDWSAPAPWPIFRATAWLMRSIDKLRDAVTPPPQRVLDHAFGMAKTQGVYVLAKLRIPDLLKDKPMTAAELAPLTGVQHATELDRVLRLLVVENMLGASVDGGGVCHYFNNKLSAALRSDHPNTMQNFVLHIAEDCYAPWGQLVPGLQQGKLPFELVEGSDIWAYYNKHPELEEQFSRAMTETNKFGMKAMVQDYPWAQYSRVLDIGGAYGSALAAILESQPALEGVLFDLPQVAERAQMVWEEQKPHLLSRTTIVGGSFFDASTVPAATSNGDAYLLRIVLHDWDDNKTIAILQSMRTAIGSHKAKVVILERTPAESPLEEPLPVRPLRDVHMLALTAGMERTEREWRALLPQAGFKLNKVVPSRSPFSVTEAVPV